MFCSYWAIGEKNSLLVIKSQPNNYGCKIYFADSGFKNFSFKIKTGLDKQILVVTCNYL